MADTKVPVCDAAEAESVSESVVARFAGTDDVLMVVGDYLVSIAPT